LLSREGLDPEIDISGDKLEELRNQYNKKYEEIFERPAPSGSSE
jgi:hypothetical protein